MSSWPVTYERKVRYSDVDSQAIVFNGNYLSYYDDAITDVFLAAGMSAKTMHEEGYDVVTAHASVDFKSTATLFEDLKVRVRVGKFGNTSITFELESVVGDRTTTTATIIYVTVDAATFRPLPVPKSLKDAMQAIHENPIPGND